MAYRNVKFLVTQLQYLYVSISYKNPKSGSGPVIHASTIHLHVNIVVLNLPFTDMEFVEALTEGVSRVVLVRGGGHEVVTIYS